MTPTPSESEGQVGLNKDINKDINKENKPISSKRKPPKGFPEPTGDQLGDWLKASRAVEEKNRPLVEIINKLTAGLNYNFPRLGERVGFDRVVKLIQKDGRDVDAFVAWARGMNRDPHWYGVKPDSLWGDWPQAFPIQKWGSDEGRPSESEYEKRMNE